VRLIKRISSPLLGFHVGQPSTFSLLPTSIEDREGQIQEAWGHGEAHQEDLLASFWPPGRTSFILLHPPYLNQRQRGSDPGSRRPGWGSTRGSPEIFLPSTWPPGRIAFILLHPSYLNKDREDQIQEEEATVRLIKKISSPLLVL
jgi:hypothetical protein